MALSYSKLQLYRRCPRQYEYACVKKLPRQISQAESFGSSVHNALKRWGEIEMRDSRFEKSQLSMFSDEKNTASSESQVSSLEDPAPLTTDTLLTLWHQAFIVEGYETRVEADHARQRGEQLMAQFFAWWQAEPRQVAAVEKGFSVEINGENFTGRFDRLEKVDDGIHVIDFKTSAARTQDAVDADLQLSVYALAVQASLGQACTKLTLLFLDEDEVTERTTTRNQSQLADAKRQIALLTERIAQRDFAPTPSVKLCRGCPYRNVCDAAAV